MTLGTSRPRNWGKEAQLAKLAMIMRSRNVTYSTKPLRPSPTMQRRIQLLLAPAKDGLVLDFNSVAELTNVRRGHWEARAITNDSLIASGISERDVIAKTIEVLWQ